MKDTVPITWKSGLVQAALGAAGWVDDLAKRLAHLEDLSAPGPKTGPSASPYWLGGMFSPDAFITASRQHVAQALSCSLEELKLSLVVGAVDGVGAEGTGAREPPVMYQYTHALRHTIFETKPTADSRNESYPRNGEHPLYFFMSDYD